jgi:cytochrome c553
MKNLTVLSIMAASLLLVGCGDSATGAEAKAASAEHKTESTMKCGEGKCGDAMKKSAATEAKEAASKAVEKATEAVKETASDATSAVKEKATAAVDAAKETAASAVDSAKAAAASAATAATAAVASVVDTGAGKALYAKCAGCHGADGKMKAMGKAAVLAGQSAADLETKIAAYKAGTRNEAGMGALMKGQVAAFSDEDIKAISAYIAGL